MLHRLFPNGVFFKGYTNPLEFSLRAFVARWTKKWASPYQLNDAEGLEKLIRPTTGPQAPD